MSTAVLRELVGLGRYIHKYYISPFRYSSHRDLVVLGSSPYRNFDTTVSGLWRSAFQTVLFCRPPQKMAFAAYTFSLPSKEDYELFLSRAFVALHWKLQSLHQCESKHDRDTLELSIEYSKMHIRDLQSEYVKFYGELPKAYRFTKLLQNGTNETSK